MSRLLIGKRPVSRPASTKANSSPTCPRILAVRTKSGELSRGATTGAS
jgi:hypothetical protein